MVRFVASAKGNAKIATVPIPHKGLILEGSPFADDPFGASTLENFVPGVPGKLMLRTGVEERTWYSTDLPLPSSARHSHIYRAGRELSFVSSGSGDNYAHLQYKREYLGATTPDDTVTVYTITQTSGGGAPLKVGLYPRPTRIAGYLWNFQYGVLSAPGRGGVNWHAWPNYRGPNNFVSAPRLNALTAMSESTSTGTAYVNAPDGGIAVASHYDRLFVLGGRDPSDNNGAEAGATTRPGNVSYSTLFWSNQFTALPTDNLALWQDPVSGLVNKLIIGADDGTDNGVAIVSFQGQLLIFKERTIWVLSGATSTQFSLRQINSRFGCTDIRTIVESDEAVYFQSQQGFQKFDGVRFTRIDEKLRGEARLFETDYLAANFVAPNHILLYSAISPGAAAHVIYDMVADTFTRAKITHASGDIAYPTISHYDAPRDEQVTYWKYAGSSSLNGRSFPKGGRFPAPHRTDITTAAADDLNSENTFIGGGLYTSRYHAIVATWTTRFLRVGTPLQAALLKRFILEAQYSLPAGQTQSYLTVRWSDENSTGSTATLGASSTVPKPLSRFTTDVFNESTSAQLRVQFGVGAPAVATLSNATWIGFQHLALFSAYLEYTASNRQSAA